MAESPIKWVGGKGRLLPTIRRYLPEGIEDMPIVELFAGGAALTFDLEPPAALLIDNNLHLMRMYRALRDEREPVIRSLRQLARRYSREHYYRVRTRFNDWQRARPSQTVAAEFLYLNRGGYNGLFRQNGAGGFNVPFGDRARGSLVDVEKLRRASSVLGSTLLCCGDFETARANHVAWSNAFVYADPPYAPTSAASFHGYLAGGFRHDDHVRLRDFVLELGRDGARVMVSNADTPFVRDIYRQPGWRIRKVSNTRSVSRDGRARGKVQELLITNY